MKKTLVVLLILAVAGGVFAQATPYGGVRLNFGVTKAMGENSKFVLDNDEQTEWIFGVKNSGTKIGVKLGDGDGVGGWAQWRMDGVFQTEGWVALGPVVLKIGNSERDWSQWSSIDFLGDGNWGFGASSDLGAPYLEAAYVADNLKVYFGLNEAGAGGKLLASKGSDKIVRVDKGAAGYDPKDPSTWTFASAAYAPFPGFYLGGDYTMEGIGTFGAAFAGQYVGGDDDTHGNAPKGTFPLMFNLHGRVTMVEPLTIGLNLAFYMAPSNAPDFFAIAAGDARHVIGGSEAMVLEALLDVSANLDPLKVGFSAAYVMDFADKKEKGGGGSALRIGLNANIGVGEGFSIIPGIIYTNYLKVPGKGDDGEPAAVNGKKANLAGGITFAYNF